MLARIVVVSAALVAASGCAASLRERVTPFPPGTPTTVPWTLNRELLMPSNARIAIVVALERGHAPEPAALDTLARIAAKYGERPAQLYALGSDGAPPLAVVGDRVVATAPLARDTSYVLVRYVGEALPKWGLSYRVGAGGHVIYVIEINQERHRRWRGLLPERHLEAQTLVHEYGHLIGLPPFDHGYFVYYPSFADGAHCVNPDCALSKPRFRALLYNFVHIAFGRHYLEDYCAQCKAAIAAAKRWWRMRRIA